LWRPRCNACSRRSLICVWFIPGRYVAPTDVSGHGQRSITRVRWEHARTIPWTCLRGPSHERSGSAAGCGRMGPEPARGPRRSRRAGLDFCALA
jgi:hypothetical protein